MSALDHVNEWPVTSASAGWVRHHGQCSTIGPASSPFPLASVTKALFAYVVLVAIEEGTLGADQPAGPDGATVRHLLSHSSGLPVDSTTPITGVAQRRIYSNAGFELVGRLLEEASGLDAAIYFHEALAAPLGLTATRLNGSVAHGASSSVDDLLAVAREWLSPTLIAPQTMAEATLPHLGGLGGVLPGFGRQEPNPWGLGFELRGNKTPHWTGNHCSPATFGHFGRAGTFIWVDPEAGVGCVALTDREFGPWAAERWPRLSDAVLAETTSTVR